MPLGTEVDLGPGHIVLDGVPAVQERDTAAPLFSAHVYCGHGRPSQLLLSSCYFMWCPKKGTLKALKKYKKGYKLNYFFKAFTMICLRVLMLLLGRQEGHLACKTEW